MCVGETGLRLQSRGSMVEESSRLPHRWPNVRGILENGYGTYCTEIIGSHLLPPWGVFGRQLPKEQLDTMCRQALLYGVTSSGLGIHGPRHVYIGGDLN